MAPDTDQTARTERLRREEREGPQQHHLPPREQARVGRQPPDVYTLNDLDVLQGIPAATPPYTTCLQSIDELLARDRQRAKDGFPRKIRVGRMIKPGTRGKEKVVVVPTTVEEKLIHDQVRLHPIRRRSVLLPGDREPDRESAFLPPWWAPRRLFPCRGCRV